MKLSGVRYLFDEISEFSRRGAIIISAGVDLHGSTFEGLQSLYQAVGERGEIWVFHNETGTFSPTFHPKIYLFANEREAEVIVGSGNLTEGGLFTNYEASLSLTLNLDLDTDRNIYERIIAYLDAWQDQASGTASRLTNELLDRLLQSDYIIREREAQTRTFHPRSIRERGERAQLFASRNIPRPPAVRFSGTYAREEQTEREPEGGEIERAEQAPIDIRAVRATGFLMTLQRTDVGVGQLTAGASRRSPEIFIPLTARNANPDFWGWDYLFTPDPSKPGKMDRNDVRMRLGTSIIEVNMMTWPDKHDFRLRNEALRSAGEVGDILRIERTDDNRSYAYYVEVIPQGTTEYNYYLSLCTNRTPSSRRLWGYY